ncbi:MAG: hypothetical protein M3T56_18270 [Chloroflexota bacterium]|nr:hypothetical protein [Chloroflexota bacterium]
MTYVAILPVAASALTTTTGLVLIALTPKVGDEVDLDNLRTDLLGAVNRTMSPAHASLWLRQRAR